MTEGMARWWSKKNPSFVSFYRYTKIVAKYRQVVSGNNLTSSRKKKYFPQIKIKRKNSLFLV